MARDEDQRITRLVERERFRLWSFIRRRVADARDAEDILQDVFAELVEANRLLMPIEHATAWLFRVARNRITDLLRRTPTRSLSDAVGPREGNESLALADLLPSPAAGPEASFARQRFLRALESAIDELPEEQRRVFIAHELEERSFKEIAAETGVNLNTLLARKRYAVLHLRRRLQGFHDNGLET